MFDILNQMAANKVETHVMWTLSFSWHVSFETRRDGVQLKVAENGKDLQDTFDTALAKFRRITGAAPELLPPRLAAPAPIPETPFVELNDEIPF